MAEGLNLRWGACSRKWLLDVSRLLNLLMALLHRGLLSSSSYERQRLDELEGILGNGFVFYDTDRPAANAMLSPYGLDVSFTDRRAVCHGARTTVVRCISIKLLNNYEHEGD